MEESSGKANGNDIRKVRGSSKSTARRLNLKTAESIVREIIAETQHEENVSEDTVPSSGNKRRRESLLADAFHSGSYWIIPYSILNTSLKLMIFPHE